MTIKCLIFDCDGTLVDSELLSGKALELKLRELGIEESAEAMVRRYRGGKLSEVLRDLEGRHGTRFDESFVGNYRAAVARLFEAELEPVSGVVAALERIALPKCVASNGPIEKVEQALRVSGLTRFFDGKLFSSYAIGSWKPEPDLLLHAAREMQVDVAECLVVDDSPLGLEAARRAGMSALFFDPDGTGPNVDATNVRVLRSMDMLPSLIPGE